MARIASGLVATRENGVTFASVVILDTEDDRVLAKATAEGVDLAGTGAEAWNKLSAVARSLAEVLLIDAPPDVAEAWARSFRVPTATVLKTPPGGRALEGLAPGESAPLSKDGRLVGHAWRPARAWATLYVHPVWKLDAKEAFEAARSLVRGGEEPEPLARARAVGSG